MNKCLRHLEKTATKRWMDSLCPATLKFQTANLGKISTVTISKQDYSSPVDLQLADCVQSYFPTKNSLLGFQLRCARTAGAGTAMGTKWQQRTLASKGCCHCGTPNIPIKIPIGIACLKKFLVLLGLRFRTSKLVGKRLQK